MAGAGRCGVRQCYRLRLVLFSWKLFRLIPTAWRLSEQEKYFEGFAVDWLGFELCFEKLREVGSRLRTKEEIQNDMKGTS